jgi:hypothetical protein
MVSYRIANLGLPVPSGQTVSVPVLQNPPPHSLIEQTGSGLPVLPLIIAGVMVVSAVVFW